MSRFRGAAFGAAAISVTLAAWTAPAGAIVPKAQSGIMAGYEITPGVAVTSASTRVRLPSITCPASGTSQVIFFAGVSHGSVAAGTFQTDSAAGVILQCSSGALSYLGVTAINNTPSVSPLVFAANDVVALSAKQTPAGAYALIRDITKGNSDKETGTPGSNGGSDDTADIGTQAYSGPIAPFGTVKFTANKVNGSDAGSMTKTAYDYFDGTSITMQVGRYDTTHNRFAITTP